MIGAMAKCFKVNSLEERDLLETIKGDVVYIRNHPFVYLNTGEENKWQVFSKVYVSKTHPKYNMDKINSLEEPYLFKIENLDNLDAVPAKPGDLIYRNGDSFMYMKKYMSGVVEYIKIFKV
jgi:hypothetical protein